MVQVPIMEQPVVAFAAVHTFPHMPQLAVVVSEVSQPLPSIVSQLPRPGLQKSMRHIPVPQVAAAPARVHATPQPPQLASEVRAVSHPSTSDMLQLPQPASQLETAQVPVVHVSVEFGRTQAVPQVPQSVTVRMDVSQPLESMLSQSSRPTLQLPMLQTPVEQSAVANAREHVIPQPPQFASVRVLVSQPSATLPLQSAQPALHETISHVPVVQLPLAFAGAHAIPQAPQLVSVLTRVSHPLALMPSQLPYPTAQSVSVHAPVAQEAVPFGNEHGIPHPPQFMRLRMLVSQPFVVLMSQSSKPGAHVVTRHVPVEQSPEPLEGAQIEPQAPQSALVVSGVSHPFMSRPSQSPQRGEQLATSQVPLAQVESALFRAQVTPQPPQWLVEVNAVSQPSPSSPLQSPQPGSQVPTWHIPAAEHVFTMTWGSAHTTPQSPQLVIVVVLVSQPSAADMLQSPKPGSQVVVTQVPPMHAVPLTWTPRGQRMSGSPLSIMPSQSSSTPLHVSLPELFTSVSVSSQSVPRQPTPVPCRSPSGSTQHRSPTGAQTGSGIVDVKFATHSKRSGQSDSSNMQFGKQAIPPEVSGAQ
jgi:hypothetical protein